MGEQQDLFSEIMPPPQPRHVERMQQVQEGLPAQLFLGTTSWSNADWEGLIYPEGCASADYIEHYAKVFGSVEIDSTWYRVPTPKAIEGWLRRTPPHFRFTAKIPRAISHEKMLVDCMGEMEAFLDAMAPLGERLGPLLMQFPYIARGQDAHENEYGSAFTERLAEFLPQLPTDGFRFAVEVRNGSWLRPELLDLLREHGVALVLNNYYTMPSLADTLNRVDPVTADFLYVRFFGRPQKDGRLRRGADSQGRTGAALGPPRLGPRRRDPAVGTGGARTSGSRAGAGRVRIFQQPLRRIRTRLTRHFLLRRGRDDFCPYFGVFPKVGCRFNGSVQV